MLRSLLVTLALVAALAPSAFGQTIIYVDADASGAEDGTSWENAFEELDEALEAATAPAQIWVAEGVYRPTDDPDRDESFRLKSGVAVLGGFTGTETSADQRTPDPDEGGTVLSGDIGIEGDEDDNSYHVVTAIGVDQTAVLDGFLITGGNADGGAPNERGGGLTNYDGNSPTTADTEGYPTLRNIAFEGNVAGVGGGAYFNLTAGAVVLEDVEFKENEAFLGGGLYTNADIEGEGVEFEENEAVERGAGAFVNSAAVTLRDVEFDSNVVGDADTPLAVGRGAGLYSQGSAEIVVIDAEFELNRAVGDFGDGAGLLSQGGTVDVVNAVFVGGVARAGAAVMTRNGSPTVTLTNVVVAGNQGAEDTWGVLDFNESTEVTMSQITVSGNDGFAVLRVGGDVTAEVSNSIFWDNDGTTILVDGSGGGELEVENSIVEGGFPDGEAILADDPLFVRAPDDGPDDEWGTDDDDYGDLHLLARSPATNFGDAGDVPLDVFDLDDDGVTGEVLPFDLDGEDRIQDGRVDLGTYEGVETPVSTDGVLEGATLALSPAAPNPLRGRGAVMLTLEAAGPVEVAVFDLLGRAVMRLHDGPLAARTHVLEVDAAALSAGVYVLRASSRAGTATRRVTVVR